jgi:hypothetical protein
MLEQINEDYKKRKVKAASHNNVCNCPTIDGTECSNALFLVERSKLNHERDHNYPSNGKFTFYIKHTFTIFINHTVMLPGSLNSDIIWIFLYGPPPVVSLEHYENKVQDQVS